MIVHKYHFAFLASSRLFIEICLYLSLVHSGKAYALNSAITNAATGPLDVSYTGSVAAACWQRSCLSCLHRLPPY